MSRVLLIGCGGVGTVAAHKLAQNADVFTDICIASRTKSKCDATAEAIRAKGYSKNGVVANITTAQVDADNVPELVALMKEFKPELCINLALPYQDLTIMDACLEAGVNYMDTANYEPKDEAHFDTNPRTRHISNTAGSGPTASVSRRLVFALSSAAVSIQV